MYSSVIRQRYVGYGMFLLLVVDAYASRTSFSSFQPSCVPSLTSLKTLGKLNAFGETYKTHFVEDTQNMNTSDAYH